MSKNNTYARFQDDLFSLYCLTKESLVEDVFIKFAAQVVADFLTWLETNEKKLRSKVKDKKVLDLLLMLGFVRRKQGSELNELKVIEYVFSTPENKQALFYLLAFSALLGDKNVGDILSPFADIINLLVSRLNKPSLGKPDKGQPLDESGKERAFEDLKAINDLYVTQVNVNEEKKKIEEQKNKENEKNQINNLTRERYLKKRTGYGSRVQQQPMFDALINRFTADIITAANNVKKSALSVYPRTPQSIASEKRMNDLLVLLGSKNGLLNSVLLINISGFMINNTKRLLPLILGEQYEIGYFSHNYETIKMTFMTGIPRGVMPDEEQDLEIKKTVEELKRSTSPVPYLAGAPSVAATAPLNVNNEQLTNEFFLSGLVNFFIEYNKILQSLPS